MKKILLTFLIIILALPAIWADNYYFEIKQEYTVSFIQSELETIIYEAPDSATIYISGSKTNANEVLFIYISKGKTVIWEANYQSSPDVMISTLLSFSGNGTLEVANNGVLITENAHAIKAIGPNSTVIVSGNGKVQTSGNGMHAITADGYVEIKDNAYLSSTTGETVESNRNNAIVRVTGGTITATSENAIITIGKNAKIYITGGYVYNDAVSNYPVVYAKDLEHNIYTSIQVSGSGKVEAKGYGSAIFSHGSAFVSGDAQVNNNLSGADNTSATIWASNIVEVTENAQVTALTNYAVFCYDKIIVSGNSRIVAKDDAIAIYNDSPNQVNIEIKDRAQVLAANNYAVSFNKQASWYYTYIKGGVLFAFGKEASDVFVKPNYLFLSENGVVLAWNKDAGNTNYEMFSADDIFKMPESATAYWDIQNGKHGISYAYDYNTGFIPIEEVNVMTSINETGFPEILVYPNPTGGELRIIPLQELKGWTAKPDGVVELLITGVEIFDIYGRKCHVSRVTCHEIKINISHLPAGVYFVKVTTEQGTVTKKVVKK